MPSYLVPALYYSTNLSDVVLALLGPWFAMFASSYLAFFCWFCGSNSDGAAAQNRAKEGRKYENLAFYEMRPILTRQKDTMLTMRMPLAAAVALGGIALHFI